MVAACEPDILGILEAQAKQCVEHFDAAVTSIRLVSRN